MSEKFQLVLDVAQKAQVLPPLGVRSGGASVPASPSGDPQRRRPGLSVVSGPAVSLPFGPEAAPKTTLVGGRALPVEAVGWHPLEGGAPTRRAQLSPGGAWPGTSVSVRQPGLCTGPAPLSSAHEWLCHPAMATRGLDLSGRPVNPALLTWPCGRGPVVIVASPHRTSLARWPTSWKRSRSE